MRILENTLIEKAIRGKRKRKEGIAVYTAI